MTNRTFQKGAFPSTIVLAMSLAVLFSAAFFIFFYLSLSRNNEVARANVRNAFEAGELLHSAGKLLGNTNLGVHQFNDCLILAQSIDQRPGLASALTVSPITTRFSGPIAQEPGPLLPASIAEPAAEDDPCPVLYRLAMGETPSADIEYYHRYMHGHTVLVRYLLPLMSVRDIRLLYSSLLTVTSTVGLAYALFMVAIGPQQTVFLPWVCIFLAITRWFGLESFSQSLSHGPSDLILVSYLLFLCLGASAVLRGAKAGRPHCLVTHLIRYLV